MLKKDWDEMVRMLILRLRHDPGSPKGKAWCDGYHEGIVDMANNIEKELRHAYKVLRNRAE